MGNDQKASLEVIENQDVLGHHQEDIRNTQGVRLFTLEPGFNVVDGFVAEIADQSTCKPG